ncbi:hypothetical protein LRAMOSA00461 [Lichtheimia ramosa]|uniref:Histone deacetylase domain-containing protein n=1 Tax=Lichtheimia ramosa TaxID=688394 RepID=A0A077W943_9FUNG|nr:hypothetical protein LRAMOSA00461 [Lichtheimia ramosa]
MVSNPTMQVVYSPDGMLHDPPTEVTRGEAKPYLESPARLASIKAFIDSQPNQFSVISPQDYSLTPIVQVHEQDYIEFLSTIHQDWVKDGMPPAGTTGESFVLSNVVGKLDPAVLKKNVNQTATGRIGYYTFDMSVAFMKDTWRAAYVSAQIAMTAAHKLLKEQSSSIYALCRPPGHHATCNVAGGYCFINNVAVVTRFVQDYTIEEMDAMVKTLEYDEKNSLIPSAPKPSTRSSPRKKVLILDIDHHHGNGTQDIFYDDPSVLYVSLHGYPDYPFFTGSTEEIGQGEGKGYNINIPLDPKTTTDEIYLENLERVLQSQHVIDFGAEFVIVSMGLDTWHEDPVAGMKGVKKVETYFEMGKLIKNSKSTTGRQVLFVQEGGYTIEKLGLLAGRVLQGFME